MLWAWPGRRRKPLAPFWSKIQKLFSCDYSTAVNLDLEFIRFQASLYQQYSLIEPFARSQLFWIKEISLQIVCVVQWQAGEQAMLSSRTEDPRNCILIPWSLSVCDSGWQNSGLSTSEKPWPTPNFSFQKANKQNLIVSKHVLVVLPFINLKHISIFDISYVFFSSTPINWTRIWLAGSGKVARLVDRWKWSSEASGIESWVFDTVE